MSGKSETLSETSSSPYTLLVPKYLNLARFFPQIEQLVMFQSRQGFFTNNKKRLRTYSKRIETVVEERPQVSVTMTQCDT
jgi:hypothetical protein